MVQPNNLGISKVVNDGAFPRDRENKIDTAPLLWLLQGTLVVYAIVAKCIWCEHWVSYLVVL